MVGHKKKHWVQVTVPRFASKSPKSWPELKTEPCDGSIRWFSWDLIHEWVKCLHGKFCRYIIWPLWQSFHEILIASAGTRILKDVMAYEIINHLVKLASMISCMQISKVLVTAHLVFLGMVRVSGIHENAHASFCQQSWESKDLTQMCSLSNHST